MTHDGITRRGLLRTGAAVVGAAGLGGLRAVAAAQDAPPPAGQAKLLYGLNLLVYTATFSKDRTDLIRKVADMGFDGVEIPFNDLSVLDVKATRNARRDAGVGLTSCCVMMPGTNLCSEKAQEREAGVDRIKQMTDITVEMGGRVVAGPLYSPVRLLTGRARTAEEWKWCADGLAAAAAHARKAGAILAVEPLNRFETYVFNTAADVARMAAEVNSPALKVQMDTFHGNIEEKDTAAAIRATGKALGHFHASESDRGVPGTGQVKWKEVFGALKATGYRGYVTIESFAAGILELCAAACVWRPLYESADGLARQGLAFLKEMGRTA